MRSWPLVTARRTGIHDVAPAPEGGVWFTAQASGHLGWFDPKSGRTELIALGTGSSPHGVIPGPDKAAWRNYDACALVEVGARFPEFLIDQGKADTFLDNGLRPWLFEDAVKGTGIELTLRMHEGYDHSYYFISTFMDDHLTWHAHRLG